MNIRADSDLLQQIPVFKGCDSVPMQILAFSATRQEFSAGDEITTQDKKARAAFVILSGQVRISQQGQSPVMVEAGAFLGEVAMLGAGTYAMTAKATGPVVAARITREIFMRVVKEYPDFGRQILNNLADRLDSHMLELEGIRTLMNNARNFSDLG